MKWPGAEQLSPQANKRRPRKTPTHSPSLKGAHTTHQHSPHVPPTASRSCPYEAYCRRKPAAGDQGGCAYQEDPPVRRQPPICDGRWFTPRRSRHRPIPHQVSSEIRAGRGIELHVLGKRRRQLRCALSRKASAFYFPSLPPIEPHEAGSWRRCRRAGLVHSRQSDAARTRCRSAGPSFKAPANR